jgi:hypothetical protein
MRDDRIGRDAHQRRSQLEVRVRNCITNQYRH